MPGCLIAVVGPSGVGKDSVISGLAASDPRLVPVRRVITRAPGGSGEEFEAVDEVEFAVLAEAGRFCLHWAAHGLHYGIPAAALSDVEAGAVRLVNLSRGVVSDAARVFPRLVVLNVTARPETLERRLRGRGRESAGDVSARLARVVAPLPGGLDTRDVPNDGPLAQTLDRARQALDAALMQDLERND